MVGGLIGGYPLGHFIDIPGPRKCTCTPAIAGISDGPNVECPIHGLRTPIPELRSEGEDQ